MGYAAGRVGIAGLLLLASAMAHAQSSASFEVSDWILNNGGNPRGGVPLASASFRMTADTIGGGVPAAGLISSSFTADSGFLSPYAPPGEVNSLGFASKSQLSWASDRSAGTYDLYRETLANLADAGACFAHGLEQPGASDGELPDPDNAFFYLVAVRNRLAEEGTKGQRSDGTARPDSIPCP